jgi:hypothetical protein
MIARDGFYRWRTGRTVAVLHLRNAVTFPRGASAKNSERER